MNKKILLPVLSLAAMTLLSACQNQTPPRGIKPVSAFDIHRYAGKWYEIARLENRFEKGLVKVTATYQLQEDGSVQVINRGYNSQKQRWSQSIGKAKFTGETDRAALKVSFFGPFYASYNVIGLTDDYQTALVCGPDRSYLWLLSRQPKISAETRDYFIHLAKKAGFNTDPLIWTPQ